MKLPLSVQEQSGKQSRLSGIQNWREKLWRTQTLTHSFVSWLVEAFDFERQVMQVPSQMMWLKQVLPMGWPMPLIWRSASHDISEDVVLTIPYCLLLCHGLTRYVMSCLFFLNRQSEPTFMKYLSKEIPYDSIGTVRGCRAKRLWSKSDQRGSKSGVPFESIWLLLSHLAFVPLQLFYCTYFYYYSHSHSLYSIAGHV